jgi:hypothetical protein
LLKNANNLDILNLDAMAEECEQNEAAAAAAEEEYEEECEEDEEGDEDFNVETEAVDTGNVEEDTLDNSEAIVGSKETRYGTATRPDDDVEEDPVTPSSSDLYATSMAYKTATNRQSESFVSPENEHHADKIPETAASGPPATPLKAMSVTPSAVDSSEQLGAIMMERTPPSSAFVSRQIRSPIGASAGETEDTDANISCDKNEVGGNDRSNTTFNDTEHKIVGSSGGVDVSETESKNISKKIETNKAEDSFAWGDSMEAKVVTSTKFNNVVSQLQQNQIQHQQVKLEETGSSGAVAPQKDTVQGKVKEPSNKAKAVIAAATAALNPSTGGAAASTAPQKSGPGPGGTSKTTKPTSGRTVKPLKPKPKVAKNLDFFGVSSSTTANETVNKKKEKKTVMDGIAVGAIIDNITKANVPVKAIDEKEQFFGPVGLFGDDFGYSTHNADTDVESGLSDAGGSGSGSASGAAAGELVPPQRVPLGWFSGIVIGGDDNDTSSGGSSSSGGSGGGGGGGGGSSKNGSNPADVFSFFDNLDDDEALLKEEDPILRQVELNRTNPALAMASREAGNTIRSRALELWATFIASTGEDEEEEDGELGTAARERATGAADPAEEGNLGRERNRSASSARGGILNPLGSNTGVGSFIPGVGPPRAVRVLGWLRRLTGVTLVVFDSTGNIRFSGNTRVVRPSNGLTESAQEVTSALFTVHIHQPSAYTYVTVSVQFLHLLKLVLIILFSILMRIVIFVCAVLLVALQYLYARVSTYASNGSSNNALGLSSSFLSSHAADSLVGGVGGRQVPLLAADCLLFFLLVSRPSLSLFFMQMFVY